MLRAVEKARRLCRLFDDLQPRRLGRGLECEARLHRHLVGGREAAQQLPELEPVEDVAHVVVVEAGPARGLELELHGHVADDGDHPLAQPDLVGVGLDRRLQPAFWQLVHPLQQRLHRSEVLHELGRGLVPHPRHARDVVGRVATQRLEVDQLRRLEAVALPDLVGAVYERVGDAAPGDERLHRVGDELEAVQIARHDRDRVPSFLRDPRERADEVVGLEAGHAVDGDRESGENVAHLLDLRPQVVRHGPPAGLVLDVFLGPEGGRADVESGHGELRPRGQDDGQHRRESVHGVGHLPVRRAHRRQGEKRPVDEAVGVDQDNLSAPSFRHVQMVRMAVSTPLTGLRVQIAGAPRTEG